MWNDSRYDRFMNHYSGSDNLRGGYVIPLCPADISPILGAKF